MDTSPLYMYHSLLSSDVHCGSVITIETSSVFKFLKTTTFVSHAYVMLWDKLCDQYTNMSHETPLHVLITGASGTGKSSFITFAQAKIIKNPTPLASTKIVVSSREQQIYQYSVEDGSVVHVIKISSSTLSNMLLKEPIVWFMDGKEHLPFHQELGIFKESLLILTASPDEDNYKSFEKCDSVNYYMPWACCWNGKYYFEGSEMESGVATWTSMEEYFTNELNLIYHHCYAATRDIEKCNYVLKHFGPHPRGIFSTSTGKEITKLYNRLKEGDGNILNKLQHSGVIFYDSIIAVQRSKDISSRFLIIIPDDNFDSTNCVIQP